MRALYGGNRVYKCALGMHYRDRMGEIRGIVPNEAEAKFRRLAMKRYGYGKGSLSKALEEALTIWIAQYEAETK